MLYLLMSLEMAYRLSSQSKKARARELASFNAMPTIRCRVVRMPALTAYQTCPKHYSLVFRRPTSCIRSRLQPWCLPVVLASLSAARIRITVSCGRPLPGRMRYATSRCAAVSSTTCQYGGSRPKKTLLLHNIPSFDKLCLQCPGESPEHHHLPWGRISRFRYATSEETAYPLPLCRTMAQLLLTQLTQRTGLHPVALLNPYKTCVTLPRSWRPASGQKGATHGFRVQVHRFCGQQ